MAPRINIPMPVRARKLRSGQLDGNGPVWLQIRRLLACPILNGDWPPGTKIPTEAELTARFGTSRMTVNRAIQSLVSEGFLHRRRKVGTVVADHARERPVFEIWDVADLINRSGGVYGYQLLECVKLKQDLDKRELLGVTRATQALWLLCLHLCDGRPFQLEERLVNIDAAPAITCRPLETAGPGPWLLAHVPWSDTKHRVVALEAPRDIATHLKLRVGAACLVVERHTWNQATPVTYARLWHPGGQHSLLGHLDHGRGNGSAAATPRLS